VKQGTPSLEEQGIEAAGGGASSTSRNTATPAVWRLQAMAELSGTVPSVGNVDPVPVAVPVPGPGPVRGPCATSAEPSASTGFVFRGVGSQKREGRGKEPRGGREEG